MTSFIDVVGHELSPSDVSVGGNVNGNVDGRVTGNVTEDRPISL